MRKVLVFVVVGMVLGACAAHRADAQVTVAKLVGTWTDTRGGTWVFSANGDLTITGGPELLYMDNGKFKYGVTDTKLALSIEGKILIIGNISMSSDGKTIIVSTEGEAIHFWLTKK